MRVSSGKRTHVGPLAAAAHGGERIVDRRHPDPSCQGRGSELPVDLVVHVARVGAGIRGGG
jgi:hypothetical protein